MILSIVCICVVFAALLILYGCYTLIGVICTRIGNKAAAAAVSAEETSGDSAPIPAAEPAEPHDEESYIITIERCSSVMTAPVSGKRKTAAGSVVRGFSGNDAAEGPAPGAGSSATANGSVNSPLPGVILDVKVKVSDKVAVGSTLAVLEAMKMENTIEAPKAGTVTAVHVSKGQSVLEGEPIVSIS